MFRRSRKPEPAKSSEPFTYIHRDTKVTGDLEASGRVRVHGHIQGNVTVRGILEVAEAGVIEGDMVRATEVRIIGRVESNVQASGKIEIWKDGQLIGDVRAAALDIEEGATFTGRSEMNPGDQAVTPTLGRVIAGRPAAVEGAGVEVDRVDEGGVENAEIDEGGIEGLPAAETPAALEREKPSESVP